MLLHIVKNDITKMKVDAIVNAANTLLFGGDGVYSCNCTEILNLIKHGKIDTTPLITHRYPSRKRKIGIWW